MNAIKQTLSSLKSTAGHLLVGTGVLSVEISKEMANAAGGLATVIPQVIPTAKEVIRLPVTAAEGYISEDRKIDLAEAEAIVGDYLPSTVGEAVRTVGVATGRATAILFEEDAEHVLEADTKKVIKK